MLPQIGLNIVALDASCMASAGRMAEQLGFESVWLGEHIVVPTRIESDYPAGPNTQPFDPDSPFLDPLLVLSHIAAVTEKIRLGVGIYLLAARHPVLTAKAFATLDRLSRGRLDLGVGIGWLREEYEIFGVDWATRGALTDEMLDCMRTLLTDPRPTYRSEHFTIPEIGFEPKPVDGPTRSRILGGGYSRPGYRRAARCAGYYGRVDRFAEETRRAKEGWDLGAIRAFVRDIRRMREDQGLDPDDYEITGVVRPQPDRRQLEEFGAAGLDRVVVDPWPLVDDMHVGITTDLDAITKYAESIGIAG